MHLAASPFQYEQLSADGRRMGEGRSAGVHLSDVIRWMRVHGMGEKLGDPADRAQATDLMTMGFVLERAIEVAMRDYFSMQRNVVAQGETFLDGIYMTPDGVNVDDGAVEEDKFTKMSLRKVLVMEEGPEGKLRPKLHNGLPLVDQQKFERAFWYWVVQVASNCYGVGSTKGRIIACFVNGDYSWKPPLGNTIFMQFDLGFEEWELKRNWAMVCNARDAMVAGKDKAEDVE